MYRYLLTRPNATITPKIMKSPFAYFLLVIMLIGCKNEHQLTFSKKKLLAEECKGCPKVSIEIPEVLERSRVAQNINNAISEEIISTLLFEEKEELEVATIDDAIKSFNEGYVEITKLYDDEGENWEAKINGKVTFEDKTLLTIILDSYLYTGGAHGYTSKRFLNFDKKKGVELENWQLFSDRDGFRKLAEAKFRLQENIPVDESINHTGFMFEQDSFYLPENIGLTKKGVKLLYNQYEVASFADGPIEVILSFDEASKYLRAKIKHDNLTATTTFEETE